MSAVEGEGFGRFAPAGFASLGAGAIALVEAGAHHAHHPALVALGASAVVQVAWGALAFEQHRAWFGVLGGVIGAAALAGWLALETSGIGFVDGLAAGEGVHVADGLAALLSALAVVLLLRRGLAPDPSVAGAARVPPPEGGDEATRERREGGGAGVTVPLGRTSTMAWAAMVAVLAVVGMATVHAPPAPKAPPSSAADSGSVPTGAHDAFGLIVPFDPARRLDLSAVSGLTAPERRSIERVVPAVANATARFAHPAAAVAAGYRSLGPELGGLERYVDGALVPGSRTIDPAHPEELLYRSSGTGGRPKLVSAIFLLDPDVTPDGVPDVGGPLTEWTPVSDLCAGGTTARPVFGGTSDAAGTCPGGLLPYPTVLSLHVWVAANPCGVFSPVEDADPARGAAACGTGHHH